jgi:hypothetical protein
MFRKKGTIAMRNDFQLELAGLEQSATELSTHFWQSSTSSCFKLVTQNADEFDLVRSPDGQIDFSLAIVDIGNTGSAKAVALSLSEI